MNDQNTWYAVMMLKTALVVNVLGIERKVNYLHMPVFKTRSEADEIAGDLFQVVEVSTNKKPTE